MPRFSACALIIVALCSFLSSATTNGAIPNSGARLTQVVSDVKVLPPRSEPRAAALNDAVLDGEAVRTGTASRSELTFPDLAIIRLGANTIFSFGRAGRDVRLTAGSILLQAPSGSGGRNIRTDPVTVAITGTTVIFEHARDGASRLVVLEGGARLSLARAPAQFRDLRGGQMLEVPPRARTLGVPVEVNLKEVMRTHPLANNFRPLSSREQIARASREQANRVRSANTAAPSRGAGAPSGAPGAGAPPGAPAGPGAPAPGGTGGRGP